MRHGYRTPQGDFDYEPAEDLHDWDDEEHPINCVCPECAEWHWYESVTTGRADPFDENWEPPF